MHPYLRPILIPFFCRVLKKCGLNVAWKTQQSGQPRRLSVQRNTFLGSFAFCMILVSSSYQHRFSQLCVSYIICDKSSQLALPPVQLDMSKRTGLSCTLSFFESDALPHITQAANMPLPAIAQQFSNHGGQVAKVYVAGDKVRCKL